MMNIKNVTIIGAGQMGGGIAQVCASAGYHTSLWDTNPEAPHKALKFIDKLLTKGIDKGKINANQKAKTLENLHIKKEFHEAVSDANLVIEAIVENFDIKIETFKKIRAVSSDCYIATNTSSISITKMSSTADLGDKFVGMHFMNPVPVMKLVEGIKGLQTSEETLSMARTFVESLGKVWVEGRDYPGFIVNRILMPMINEGAHALMEGLATAQDIDTAMKLGCNLPMGPLELADFIGLDTCANILNVLYEGHGGQKFVVCPLLQQHVDAGWLGRKTGRGFFKYS